MYSLKLLSWFTYKRTSSYLHYVQWYSSMGLLLIPTQGPCGMAACSHICKQFPLLCSFFLAASLSSLGFVSIIRVVMVVIMMIILLLKLIQSLDDIVNITSIPSRIVPSFQRLRHTFE